MTNGEALGNKLYELRKKSGLSQEALADKLGVSRQAVSKWECGESLPDTDNLITISKLFEISLDELVGNSFGKTEENLEEKSAPLAGAKDAFETSETTESTEQIISDAAIIVDDAEVPKPKRRMIFKLLYGLPYPILTTIAFLLWGFLANGWAVSWTLFLTVPIYYSIIGCLEEKKFSPFAYPVFVTFAYLFIGMQWGLWHPYWILFITVPIYGAVASELDRE